MSEFCRLKHARNIVEKNENPPINRKPLPCNTVDCSAILGIVDGVVTEGSGFCADEPINPWLYEQPRVDTSAEPWLEE